MRENKKTRKRKERELERLQQKVTKRKTNTEGNRESQIATKRGREGQRQRHTETVKKYQKMFICGSGIIDIYGKKRKE